MNIHSVLARTAKALEAEAVRFTNEAQAKQVHPFLVQGYLQGMSTAWALCAREALDDLKQFSEDSLYQFSAGVNEKMKVLAAQSAAQAAQAPKAPPEKGMNGHASITPPEAESSQNLAALIPSDEPRSKGD